MSLTGTVIEINSNLSDFELRAILVELRKLTVPDSKLVEGAARDFTKKVCKLLVEKKVYLEVGTGASVSPTLAKGFGRLINSEFSDVKTIFKGMVGPNPTGLLFRDFNANKKFGRVLFSIYKSASFVGKNLTLDDPEKRLIMSIALPIIDIPTLVKGINKMADDGVSKMAVYLPKGIVETKKEALIGMLGFVESPLHPGTPKFLPPDGATVCGFELYLALKTHPNRALSLVSQINKTLEVVISLAGVKYSSPEDETFENPEANYGTDGVNWLN